MAMSQDETPMDETKTRQEWIAILAKASTEDLEKAWAAIRDRPGFRFLRPPETGLVMVRARAGGTGMRFNLGEVTVTRCTVQIDRGSTGTAYVMGRNERHAELAALFDALLQDPDRRSSLTEKVIQPLRSTLREKKVASARRAATTKVEFFTLVRGD
jgi:alpha-D-ribose 1-methylphosphonate 5-triphosphate synthase subunit PhnG